MRTSAMRRIQRLVPAAALVLLVPTAALASEPQLVILTPTGQQRQGRPVLAHHLDQERVLRVLSHGLSGRFIRLYQLEQQYLNRLDGRRVEPAYLLLSNERGGFPRFGFWLGDLDKADVGYVDIHHSQALSGLFGAIDQIFPHELAHVITMQLSGKAGFAGSTQSHALGVRTDPSVAFEEGFAEHLQVRALDDPDAAADTRRLAGDPWYARKAAEHMAAYAREVNAAWGPFARHRVGFLFWFGGTEQSLRYHAVKANAYARMPSIPDRLLASSDPYGAYLLQNVLPGDPGSPAKNAAVLLSTEAVVASLFWRWTIDDALQHRYRDAGFYEAFGVEPGSVTPFENVYLKLFDVLYRAKPHNTAALIDAYLNAFPDDAADVSRIVRATLVGQDLPRAPALWLANDGFQVGTSLYDQYRGAPHLHTFDLNAATVVDLVSVAGVDRTLAAKVLAAAPYQHVADLGAVPGVSPALMARFDAMSQRMRRLNTESGEEMSLTRMLRPAAERAGLALLLAGLAAAWLYRAVTGARIARALFNGFAISLLSLIVSWSNAAPLVVGSGVFPWLLFGVPAAALSFFLRWRQRRTGALTPKLSPSPVRVLAGWGLAALPAVLLVLAVF
jgi:hypothetical protein